MSVSAEFAKILDDQLGADLEPRAGRLGKTRRYLAGEHDMPYMPLGAKAEYKHLAERAITNWTPLLPDTFSKGLFVDGFRAAKAAKNAEAWNYWQANGLDARQTITHRGALEYGTSYVLVLPGKRKDKPRIRALSPLRSMAWYADEDDEYPEFGLHRLGGTRPDGSRRIEVYDETFRYEFTLPKDSDEFVATGTSLHRMGVVPFVRFRDRIDGEAVGIIRPIFTLQDRVNEIVFSTLIAMQYASFRQRWATGLAIPYDEDTDEPVQPFEAAVDRLWTSDSSDAKFGDFAQTDMTGHHNLYSLTVKTLAAVSQISPNILTGELVNISAEALAQMEQSTQRKMSEYETLFGEAWESVLRLAAFAAGNVRAADDNNAEVRWRDTEARSLSQTVDALGKMATMLEVPVQGIWERIPGVTDQDVSRWLEIRGEDPLDALTAELTRQTAAVGSEPTPSAEAPPDADK